MDTVSAVLLFWSRPVTSRLPVWTQKQGSFRVTVAGADEKQFGFMHQRRSGKPGGGARLSSV